MASEELITHFHLTVDEVRDVLEVMKFSPKRRTKAQDNLEERLDLFWEAATKQKEGA